MRFLGNLMFPDPPSDLAQFFQRYFGAIFGDDTPWFRC